MKDESLIQRVLHLRQVEKLSQRQIAEKLHIGRKCIRRILNGSGAAKPIPKKSILDDYVHLIAHWYKEYPLLKANQVYERLKSYGYQGSYVSVARLSRQYRKITPKVYHTLMFVPGEEAQIDWFFFNHEKLGQVAGLMSNDIVPGFWKHKRNTQHSCATSEFHSYLTQVVFYFEVVCFHCVSPYSSVFGNLLSFSPSLAVAR